MTEYTTKSEYPIKADFHGDAIVLSCEYQVYEPVNQKLVTVIKKEYLSLSFDELEEIYNHFKALRDDADMAW